MLKPLTYRGAVVPYVTKWSAEEGLPSRIVERRGRIAYSDEAIGERDEHGVLWQRMPSVPGRGRPMFGLVHSLRQRQAVRRLLCQVCAGPADRTELGPLWLLPDRRDWADWPERMACTEPPVCLSCARTALRTCPALRTGYATFRARHSVLAGVFGGQYRSSFPTPSYTGEAMVTFDDPGIRWVCASYLFRHLHDCTMVELDHAPVGS